MWSKNKKRQTCEQKIGKDKHVIKKLKTYEWSKNKKDKRVIKKLKRQTCDKKIRKDKCVIKKF